MTSIMHRYPTVSMIYEEDDVSRLSVVEEMDSSSLSTTPPSLMQQLGGIETDNMKMARESSKTETSRQHGHSQRRGSRAPAIDSRGEDNSSPHSHSRSRETGVECRDESVRILSQERTSISNNKKLLHPNDDIFSLPSLLSNTTSSLSSSVASWMGSAPDSSVQSQLSKIPIDDMTYWSSLSVRVAIAAMQANGSEKVAKKAANAVLDAGKKKRHRPTSASLRRLAAKVSVAVLEAGGDHEVAAAVTMAIMRREDDAESISIMECSPAHSRNKSEVSTSSNGDSGKTPKQDVSSSKSSNQDFASLVTTPSITTKRRHLKEKEDELAQKTRSLEEAERMNLQNEIELGKRLLELEEAEALLLKNANINRITQDRVASKSELKFNEKGLQPEVNVEGVFNKSPSRVRSEGKNADEPTTDAIKVPKARSSDQLLVSASSQNYDQTTSQTKQRKGLFSLAKKSFRKSTCEAADPTKVQSKFGNNKKTETPENNRRKGMMPSLFRKKG